MWKAVGSRNSNRPVNLMRMMVILLLFFAQLHLITTNGTNHTDLNEEEDVHVDPAIKIAAKRKARVALEFMAKFSPRSCSPTKKISVDLNLLMSDFFRAVIYAQKTSNFLSMVMNGVSNSQTGGQSVSSQYNVSDDIILDLCRSNMAVGYPAIDGFGIGFEIDVFNPPRNFAPYAYWTNSSSSKEATIVALDFATVYKNFTVANTVWFQWLRNKSFANVRLPTATQSKLTGKQRFRRTSLRRNSLHPYLVSSPSGVAVADGEWTKPFFDCGGRNSWIVSFMSPILRINSLGVPVFRGVVRSDIELARVEFNQCDVKRNTTLYSFEATHNCQPTTRCVHVRQKAFGTGHYKCVCKRGFYFPNPVTRKKDRYFRGYDVDDLKVSNGRQTPSLSKYQCLPCREGCRTCEDNSPCLYEYMMWARIVLLILLLLDILMCFTFIMFIGRFSGHYVMRMESPMLLQVMMLGGIVLCTSGIIDFPKTPTVMMCTISMWLFHIGFGILYGILFARSRRNVELIYGGTSRLALTQMKRLTIYLLGPVITAVLIYLCVWTVFSKPKVQVLVTDSKVTYEQCSRDIWNYIIMVAEALLVLFTAYMCLRISGTSVTLMSSDAKLTSFSMYNVIIMGPLLTILRYIWGCNKGPDAIYMVDVLLLQMYAAATICFVIIPKFRKIKKYDNDPGDPMWRQEVVLKSVYSTNSKMFSKASNMSSPSTVRKRTVDASMQVAEHDFDTL